MQVIQYGSTDLLSRHELAKRLAVSTATIDIWVKQGKLPVVKHPLGQGKGRKVFFSWPAVVEALQLACK